MYVFFVGHQVVFLNKKGSCKHPICTLNLFYICIKDYLKKLNSENQKIKEKKQQKGYHEYGRANISAVELKVEIMS